MEFRDNLETNQQNADANDNEEKREIFFKLLHRIQAHSAEVKNIILDKKEEKIASCADDGTIKVWRIQDSEKMHALISHRKIVNDVAWNLDENILAAASEKIRLWDSETGVCIRTFKDENTHKQLNKMRCIVWLPLGVLAGADDTTIKLWDPNSGKCSMTIGRHAGSINCIDTKKGQQVIASGSDDGFLKLWDLKKNECIQSKNMMERTNNSIKRIAWSPQGKKLAVVTKQYASIVTFNNDNSIKEDACRKDSELRDIGWLTEDLVVSDSSGGISIQNGLNGAIVHYLSFSSTMCSLKVGEKHLFVGSPTGVIKMWAYKLFS